MRILTFTLLIAAQMVVAQAPVRPEWVRRAAAQQRLVDTQAVNPFGEDLPAPTPPPTIEDIQEAASKVQGWSPDGDALLDEAAKALVRKNRIDTSKFGGNHDEELDLNPETGQLKAAEQALADMKKDETVITTDAFGPLGEGRRERLAKLAGLSPSEAARIWPYKDPGPVRVKDLAEASVLFGGKSVGISQEEVAANLVPDENQAKDEALSHTVLSDAETNFACYAAIGFPFPIRVGKIQAPPPDGFILFNPQVLSADLSNLTLRPKKVTYRWMNGETEVSKGEFEFTGYQHMPKPAYDVTHLWVSCDEDIMAYSLAGATVPNGLADLRNTVLKWVVPVNGPLRAQIKLYGLRWSLMPGIESITKHPGTRQRLKEILLELGLMREGQDLPNIGNG